MVITMLGDIKYRLFVNDRAFEVILGRRTDKRNLKVSIDGVELSYLITPIGDGIYGIKGREGAGRVYVLKREDGKEVFWQGRIYYITQEKRRRKKKGIMSQAPMDNLVTPPMPSIVRRVLVSEGDVVKKGQALIIVTSMKMETTLVSPRDGKIKSIKTREGEKVSPGDELIDFYEEADS